jgi:hypothetical protein
MDSDVDGASWLLSSSPLQIGENFIKLIGGLCFLYYLEWRAGLCVTIILPVFIVMSSFFSKRQYALVIHQGEEYARSGESMEESISNINTVKAIAGENAIRKKVMVFAGLACVIWAVGMAALFGGPLVYREMTNRVRAKGKAHYSAYKAVSDSRERVNLILSYTERQYSPLEILRVVSGYLPRGITLTGFNFKRQDGVRITGEAEMPSQVYSLKEAIDADDLFVSSTLTGPSASRGKHKFEIHVAFPVAEVDE